MAKTNIRKEILVYAHWVGIEEPTLMGILYSEITKGQEIFSFEYSKSMAKVRIFAGSRS